ncbi:uncharacterized protein LOC131845345 [Achroia grisella]|uniref:uncharacterized protein LOC131845345 n=1 Tax=Achroia grisella TaxID=688607 RepID=UPI0027D20DA3|nr:uncharacterized protein LOC131845345 [Achroia grisella]
MKKVAIDCEMVEGYSKKLLARVSIVNDSGDVIYNEYVQQNDVKNYLECITGINAAILRSEGIPFIVVQREVAKLINGHILVGHDLRADLEALGLTHPVDKIIDTYKIKPYSSHPTPSLKFLAKHYLGKNIQQGVHDSVEDARTAMELCLRVYPK